MRQDTLFPATSHALGTSALSNTARSATVQPLASLAITCSLPVEGFAHPPVQQTSPTVRSATAQQVAPSVLWVIKYQQTVHNVWISALSAVVLSASQRQPASLACLDILEALIRPLVLLNAEINIAIPASILPVAQNAKLVMFQAQVASARELAGKAMSSTPTLLAHSVDM